MYRVELTSGNQAVYFHFPGCLPGSEFIFRYSSCLFNTLQYSICLFNRYSPSLPNVKSGLMKKFYMDFFINSNSYMSDNIPDVAYTPEFERYFNFYTFCLTSDTKQSSQHLPICTTGLAFSNYCTVDVWITRYPLGKPIKPQLKWIRLLSNYIYILFVKIGNLQWQYLKQIRLLKGSPVIHTSTVQGNVQ